MTKRDAERDNDKIGDIAPALRATCPAGLIRALEWLGAHIAEPFDLERLALAAGVRPRTLESQFRTCLGTTPLAWLRRMRLARVRRELMSGRADTTVTGVALASGFTQLGRFAAEYRTAFGEVPSATLRRAAQRSAEVHPEALRLTWQAMPYVFAIAPRQCNEALEILSTAREHAPAYGLPVALAAWCLGQRAAHGFGDTPQRDRAEALRLVEDARALAPNDALALTLASGALTLAHRLAEADELLERVLAVDPALPYGWVRRGWASAYAGDHGASLRELDIALRLAPVGPMRQIACIGIGCAYFAAERYDQATRWIQIGTDSFPGAIWADRVAAAAAVHSGTRAEGRRIARRLMREDPDLTAARARTAWPFPPVFMTRLGDGLEIAGVPRG